VRARLQRKIKSKKVAARLRRHRSIRKKIFGTAQRPRLCVFRSLRYIYGALIDDESGRTLLSESTLSLCKKGSLQRGSNKEAAMVAGESLGKKALDKGITAVVFDRAGYAYHGRVKAFAEGARKAGLRF